MMKRINCKILQRGLFAAILSLLFFTQAVAGNAFTRDADQAKVAVSGLIVDERGEALVGVSVLVKGTTNGTTTGMDGRFTLNCAPEDLLLISYIGFKPMEVKANENLSRIVLQEDVELLEEVVVIGYGTMKKSSLTGSSTHVKAEQIEGFPSVSVLDAVQGLAAGVQISPSRQPGEDPSIIIRGTRSLKASNSPLLIVDGMPGSWENVSTEDIASMEILKDAAATAVYGSRAANGVILITTKEAKKGDKIKVELSSYVGLNKYRLPKYATPEHYAEMVRDVVRMQVYGLDKAAWEASDIDTKEAMSRWNATWHDNYYENGISFDWQDALFNDSSFNTGHSISISNSNDKTSYRVSYNFQDNNSYYETVSYQRHILSSNIKYKFNKYVDMGVITRLSYRKNTGWPGDMVENLIRMTPFETPYVDEDPAKGYKDRVGSENYVNAMLNYQDGNYVDDRIGKRADVIGALNVRPFSWLTFTTNLKLGFNEYSRGEYYDSKTVNRNLGYNYARFDKGSSQNYTWNAILTFDKTFGVHHINATAITEAIEDKSESVAAKSENIPAAYMDYHFLSSGTQGQEVSSNFNKSNLLSYMFRMQYEYNSKYLFNVAFRYDGSSRLAKDNRWRLFPSASMAWRITEEEFLKNNPVVSTLKLRASYGEIGNQAIGTYETMTTLKSKTYNWYGGNGFYTWQPNGLANKALGWEISKTWNVGLDFGFMKNRLEGTVEYYNTRNVDLLMNRSIPETTGFSSLTQNIGTTQNVGIEASLNYNLIQTKDIQWVIGGNFSRNWNKIVDLLDGQDDPGNGWYIGKPISMVREYQLLGIWQLDEKDQAKVYNREPGNPKVADLDGDGKLTDDDKIFWGQRAPKVLASLQSSFRYKGFDFSFNLVGQFGHYIRSSNVVPLWNGTRWPIDAIEWWTPLNETSKWPRMQTGYTQSDTGLWDIQKGDFIKLQNISLGYDFGKAASNWVNVDRIRVYLQASNLGYIYKNCYSFLNPEQANTMYTIPASFVFGVNLSF